MLHRIPWLPAAVSPHPPGLWFGRNGPPPAPRTERFRGSHTLPAATPPPGRDGAPHMCPLTTPRPRVRHTEGAAVHIAARTRAERRSEHETEWGLQATPPPPNPSPHPPANPETKKQLLYPEASPPPEGPPPVGGDRSGQHPPPRLAKIALPKKENQGGNCQYGSRRTCLSSRVALLVWRSALMHTSCWGAGHVPY